MFWCGIVTNVNHWLIVKNLVSFASRSTVCYFTQSKIATEKHDGAQYSKMSSGRKVFLEI